jgi:hypothetical protein
MRTGSPPEDVQMGYVLLLDALADRRLGPSVFREACASLWIADRDATHRPDTVPAPQEGQALLDAAFAGRLTSAQFVQGWCKLWRFGQRTGEIQRLLDTLHSTAYLFTDDAKALAQDPAFFSGEDMLRAEAERIRISLRELAGRA